MEKDPNRTGIRYLQNYCMINFDVQSWGEFLAQMKLFLPCQTTQDEPKTVTDSLEETGELGAPTQIILSGLTDIELVLTFWCRFSGSGMSGVRTLEGVGKYF